MRKERCISCLLPTYDSNTQSRIREHNCFTSALSVPVRQKAMFMKNKTVFIVEDDTGIRDLIRIILTNDHYGIQLFANAKTFSQHISAALPDLIILDMMLPDGNGLDICKKLKSGRSTAHIPVLLMSAGGNQDEIILQAGATDFISKPFDIAIFREKVEAYL